MTTKQKVRIGRVISDKMDKTVVVAVEMRRQHRLYRRTIQVRRKYKVHDETNACKLGDLVRIVETRPLSKEKRWRVSEILVHHDIGALPPQEIGTSVATTAPESEAESAETPAVTEAP